MKFKNFTLDPFQEDAIKAIEKGDSVVVSAPTGSGKTLVADYIIDSTQQSGKKIIYTAPIKALSNQKYKDFSRAYGADQVGLMTGDIVINPGARVIIMTTEIYRNMAISQDEDLKNIAYVIFDEVHYINDIERGYVWEESIIYSKESVRFLCLSATIPNAQEFSSWISAIKGHEVKTIVSTKRNVPLDHKFYDYELGLTSLEKIDKVAKIPGYDSVFRKRGKKVRVPKPNHVALIQDLGVGKLPCLFFSFSRKDCQQKAKELAKRNLFARSSEIVSFIRESLAKAPKEINRLRSTQVIKETLPQGIAFHHAGLLPVIKEMVEELFGRGLIKVLYTTETFAVGINMPAKTVCFADLRKYDGISFRYLNTKEYFQIAGRAGRRGIDTQGHVVSMIFRPTFSYKEVKRITYKDIEPIKSQFKLSINTVLNLVDQHTEDEIEHILRMSFFSYQKFGEKFDEVPTKKLMARYNSICRELSKFGYIVNGSLSSKGKFSSKVFADEIAMGELFATNFAKEFDEYQILLTLACLVYEHRPMTRFKKTFANDVSMKLRKRLCKHPYLKDVKKFTNMKRITAFVKPVYDGESLFDVLEYTSLVEGDLIRIYQQIMDRIGQIMKASADSDLRRKIENCKGIIEKVLEGIYEIE